MVEFRNILCPIDLSEASSRALVHAAAFARWYGARLTVLHVVPTFDPRQVRSGAIGEAVTIVHPVSREEVVSELRRALDEAGAGNLDAAVAAEAGEPAATIVDQAVRIGADLLVIGTHGRSGFDRLLLGSVTEKVLRKAPCPILTVPPHVVPAAPKAEVIFRRILCPMDFSPPALQAFGFAVDLARQANGTVTVLHVIEWLAEEEPREHAHFNVPEYRQHLVAHARERLRALVAEEPRTWCEIEEMVAVGRPYREVLKTAAATKTDLIVMGAQGRGGVGLVLFGSTTQQVVRTATCPVLTVRG
ncbi:MAG: universal stress protein [Acidobacteria bacterium]|nr:universal stress protein [Acidobacteriota bacterium]